MNKVSLNIVYDNGVIEIPFKSIKSIDMFTIMFNNNKDLYEKLKEILNLNIEWDKIREIYISYEYDSRYNSDYIVVEELPLRFSQDDYDIEDLKKVYSQYYKDNYMRILATKNGIRHVNHDKIRKFTAKSDNVSDNDIDMAVNAYFKGDSYKKYRDAYYLLIKHGYSVKKNIDKQHRTNLGEFMTDNEYFEYLRSYATKGDNEYDRVIEKLSYEDIDSTKGLFDGNSRFRNDLDTELTIQALEALTGKNLDDLRNLFIDLGDTQRRNTGRR